ncbi:MAG: ATP-dependent helicase, partial [Candidatus Methylomirabilales bacterium]
LLDEYQDTNVAQRRLMQLLAPTGHNVTAVGDARQNIYEWRGSTLFNLIDFPTRHFLRRGGLPHEYLSLSKNFRSGSKILAVANRIVDLIPEDRRPGKPLSAHRDNGEGLVAVKLVADQGDEASFIAEEVGHLHGRPAQPGREPTAWSDFAILVRRRAHIAPIYAALTERDIPVEVVGLGGLLQLPEVVDTVAWLRVLADPGPEANPWLARILLGPRFRIHYADLTLLARWASHRSFSLAEEKKMRQGASGEGASGLADETEFEPDAVAYSLTEALDHLEEIEGLQPEARRRLERARSGLATLRPRAGGLLLELVQAVVEEAGIAEALEATPGIPCASATANLTSFLGTVANFAPVSGEATLAAFLAYLDASEEVDETHELASPTAADSVKLMTVHRAKGLEFEVVFVPAVAARTGEKGEKKESIFPDERTSNPMTSHTQLPNTVREDSAHLPSPWLSDGRPKKQAEFHSELKQRAVEDERRLFYVALTRAKQRLYVTAAWWYGRGTREKGPSSFFQEVAEA